jgi:hypothetical protein
MFKAKKDARKPLTDAAEPPSEAPVHAAPPPTKDEMVAPPPSPLPVALRQERAKRAAFIACGVIGLIVLVILAAMMLMGAFTKAPLVCTTGDGAIDRSSQCVVQMHLQAREKAANAMVEGLEEAEPWDDVGEHWDLRTYKAADGTNFYPYVFSKTFSHNADHGFPMKRDVDTMLEFVRNPSLSALDGIRLHDDRVRRLEGIPSQLNFNFLGADASMPRFHFFYPVDSAQHAFQMAEVYAMSLLRDVPFHQYESSPLVAKVIAQLNRFEDKTSAPVDSKTHITPGTLLRGAGPGETVGPYVSQFVLHPFKYGSIAIESKFAPEMDPTNALTMEGWRAVQEGVTTSVLTTGPPQFAGSARVLGSMVRARSARTAALSLRRALRTPARACALFCRSLIAALPPTAPPRRRLRAHRCTTTRSTSSTTMRR